MTTRRVGRDMAAYTSWSDRVCQQLWASFVDTAAIGLPQINSKHSQSRKELDMWQLELFTKRNTLQIVHSVSGNVVFKHLKQLLLSLSRISCEVKCTVRECECECELDHKLLLLIKAFATNQHQNGTWYFFFFFFRINLSNIPLPPLSYSYHEHKWYHCIRFVSHKLKTMGWSAQHVEACFHTNMMEQSGSLTRDSPAIFYINT